MKAFFEHHTYDSKMPLFAVVIENLDFAAHWHSDIELLYVMEGSIGVGSNMQYRILHSGDLSVCGSNDIHYYNSNNMESRVLLIICKPEFLDPLCTEGVRINPYSAVFSDTPEKCRRSQREIVTDITSNGIETNQPSLRLRVLELFLLIFRNSPSYYTSSLNRTVLYSSANPIQIALKYIEDHFAQDISLDIISNKASLSPYYFSRLFKKTTGTNFKAYLNHIRINKAADMIRSSQKRIIDIAYETGFCSIRTFNRTFLAITGHAPSAIRNY